MPFRNKLRRTDALKHEIDSHASVYHLKQKALAAAGIHGPGSEQHKAAIEHYKTAFEAHPKAKEYHEIVRASLKEALVEEAQGALKYVKKVDGEWVLYSIHTGKTLKKFGPTKPSREEAAKALQAVEYFKHHGD